MANVRRMSSVCAAVVLGTMPAVVTASIPPRAGQATPASGIAASIVPVEPFRILDTRSGLGTGGSTTPVGAQQTIDLQVAGVGTIPGDAIGVVLNLTGTQTTEPTYITAWPTGSQRPTASVPQRKHGLARHVHP